MLSRPSALPAKRTPAPSRPIRPRRSAPISTMGAAAPVQPGQSPTQSPSSTSRRYRSRATRSRQSSSASRPRPPSRPLHRAPPQPLSHPPPPCKLPVALRELQQRLLLRQPRLRNRERQWRPAASCPCPGKEPISSPRHRPRPSPPSRPSARSSHGPRSL